MARGQNSFVRAKDKELVTSITSCQYCGSDKDLCIEHIFPPSRGGGSHISNLTRSCKVCNSMKNSLTIDEWRKRILEKINEHEGIINNYNKILLSINSKSYIKF